MAFKFSNNPMCGKNQACIQCHAAANMHLHVTVLKPQLHADLPRSLYNKQREYTNYSGGGKGKTH